MPTSPYVDLQSIHNPATGASPPASWGDQVRDDLEFLVRRPGVVLRTTADQSGNATNGVWYNVSWNAPTDLRDTDAFHTGTTDQIVAPIAGWYLIAGGIMFDADPTGSRMVRYSINGAGDYRLAQVGSAGSTFGTKVPFAETVRLNAGDVLRIAGRQDSGGALMIKAGCHLSMHLVALT